MMVQVLRRYLYLTTHDTDIHNPGGIRNRYPSKRSAADPQSRGRYHCDRRSPISQSLPPAHTGQRSRYSDWLRAGRSGDRIPVGERFSAPVQTGPGAHPASCTMRTGSFPRVKSDLVVTLTHHPLLVPWSRRSRAIPLLTLWTERSVQSLSACTRVQFITSHRCEQDHQI